MANETDGPTKDLKAMQAEARRLFLLLTDALNAHDEDAIERYGEALTVASDELWEAERRQPNRKSLTVTL